VWGMAHRAAMTQIKKSEKDASPINARACTPGPSPKQLQPLRHQFDREIIHPGQITARPGEARNQTHSHRIFADREDHGDSARRRLGRQRSSISEAGDHGDPSTRQIGRKPGVAEDLLRHHVLFILAASQCPSRNK
jgi:hypothetical protein